MVVSGTNFVIGDSGINPFIIIIIGFDVLRVNLMLGRCNVVVFVSFYTGMGDKDRTLNSSRIK